MVRHFHDCMQTCGQIDKEYSDPLPLTNGVKQGCYGTNSVQHNVFSYSQMLFRTVMPIAALTTSYLASGGCKLNRCARKAPQCRLPRGACKNRGKMQEAMGQMSQACGNYDPTISTQKTEVVHQPAPGKPYVANHHHCEWSKTTSC